MEQVLGYLRNLLQKNDTIVVAVSGGPDSMCLIHLLNSLKDEYNLKIVIAHVNHKHRIESDEEEKKVKKYALENNDIFELLTINNYTNNKFTEDEARRKRYSFFHDIALKYNAKYLMTAHHGDDLIETILMRIVRGSNLKGYLGFKQEIKNDNYSTIRPLISVTKDEIINYCNNLNLWYAIDISNSSRVHTRNRYRQDVIPFLKKEDKFVHKKFLKFSYELTKYDEYMNNYIKSILPRVYNSKTKTLYLNELNHEDEFVRLKVIEYIITLIQEDDLLNINDKHVLGIMNIIKSRKPNLSLDLPNDYIVQKNYSELKFSKKEDLEDYKYIFDKVIKLPNNYVIKRVENTDKNSNDYLKLDSREIKLPLIVRTRLTSDRMEVKNLNGSKKVKDIFIDSKVNLNKRKNYPIVTDSENNILWIPGIKKSRFDKKNNEKYDIILEYKEEKNEQSKR